MSREKKSKETYREIVKPMADDLRKAESWCDLDGVLNRSETMYNLYKMGYRKQSEWISVEERLPQATGKYICCVKDKGENTWTIPADWSLELKMWFGEFGEIKNMVTHWMLLPEPPKKGGGDKQRKEESEDAGGDR